MRTSDPHLHNNQPHLRRVPPCPTFAVPDLCCARPLLCPTFAVPKPHPLTHLRVRRSVSPSLRLALSLPTRAPLLASNRWHWTEREHIHWGHLVFRLGEMACTCVEAKPFPRWKGGDVEGSEPRTVGASHRTEWPPREYPTEHGLLSCFVKDIV
jgi:hypothetical protein